ncbi:hypothetical protein MMJ09_13095 [Bacillus vallismortis]|nr:hypothetical protein [Bacillus vallismortis]
MKPSGQAITPLGQITVFFGTGQFVQKPGQRPSAKAPAKTDKKRGRFSITERFLKAGLHGKRERESVPFPCPLSL